MLSPHSTLAAQSFLIQYDLFRTCEEVGISFEFVAGHGIVTFNALLCYEFPEHVSFRKRMLESIQWVRKLQEPV